MWGSELRRVQRLASEDMAGRIGHARPVPDSVLLVLSRSEDERVTWMQDACEQWGWSSRVITTTERMQWAASVLRPAAVVLLDGGKDWNIEVIDKVRPSTAAPMVILGALTADRALLALRRGVDAIVPSGLSAEETLARIYAMIRRSTEILAPSTRYLDAGPIRLDLWRSVLFLDGTPVHLTTIEIKLLAFLMRNAGTTLHPHRIIDHVWQQSHGVGGENALRIAVRRLRQKLRDDARHPAVIEAVRGRGYRFLPTVVEVADEARASSVRHEQVELLDDIASLASKIASHKDRRHISALLVEHLVASGFADAAAVHEVSGDHLVLRAHRGLSEAWIESVREVPLDEGYATARVVSAGEPVQLSASVKSYRMTRAVLKGEDPGTYLFLPIEVSGEVRACVGVVRRSSRNFDTGSLAYLRAALAVIAAGWTPQSAQPLIE